MSKDDIVREDVIRSFLDADPSCGVDIVFSFDTTGSMTPFLNEVRKQVNEICEDLFTNVPNIHIAIITHGDFCDDSWIPATKIQIFDFTNDKQKLTKHIKTVGNTGGEGAHAAYEYVLHEANKLKWRPAAAKALVLIGDVVPNAPSWTDQDYYWRTEMNKLYRKGVKIYGVQAYSYDFSLPFYQEISRRTGGCFLRLNQMQFITDMLRGITYKEAGKFKEFKQQSKKKDPNYEYMIQALDRQLGNVRLNDPLEAWWDISLDKNPNQYVMDKSTKLFKRAITTVIPPRKPAKKTMEGHIAGVIQDTAETEGYSQRTGGKILDTSQYTKVQKIKMEENRKKQMANVVVDSGFRFVEVKPGVWEMVTKEEADKRNQTINPTPAATAPAATAPAATASEGPSEKPIIEGPSKKQIEERNKILQQANDQAKALREANTEKLSISKDVQKQYAVQRLMRDLLEVKRTPLYGVTAVPLENNIMQWHANITGPLGTEYDGVVFHLVIKFPSTYPRKPPTIRICSRLLHPNVYGNWVCLDMLEIGAFGSDKEADRINTGWSSGYSVVSILLQLQTFLFSDNVVDEDGDGGIFRENVHVKAAQRLADKFECKECGHHTKLDEKGKKIIYPPWVEVPENSWGSDTPVDRSYKPKKSKKTQNTAVATPAEAPVTKPEPAPVPAVNVDSMNRKKGEKALPLSFFKRDMPVEGVVISVREGLGAFVDIGADRNALLHVSAMGLNPVKSIAQERPDIVVGAKINAFVTSIDQDQFKIGITTVKDPVIRAYRGQKTIHFSELSVGDKRYGLIARKQPSSVQVNIDVYENDKKKLAVLPKESLKSPNCAIVWSAADFFENTTHVAVIITEITSRGQITCNLAPTAAPAVVSPVAAPSKVISKPVNQTSGLCNLDLSTLYNIMKHLNPITMGRLGATCKMMQKISDDGISYLWERNEILCFHSRRHYSDDTLGLGVNLESKMNGKLAYITCTYDLVSHTSFLHEEVRKASYKEKFTHWLPVFIDKTHGKRAMELAKVHMAKICSDCYGSFEPWMVLEIMPKLMNTMVVSVMSGKLYGSIMALEGYCGFHHLLLNFMIEYPELRAKADEIIKNFINDPYKRHKKEVPALGEFLPLLTVTEAYRWEDVALPYLLEMFDRNVLWTLKKYPNLASVSVTEGWKLKRVKDVFDATVVSNHLLMFHVYFLKKIARPEGMSLAQVSDLLDLRYGRPTYAMKDQLLNEVKSIRSLKTWDGFFQKINVPKPADLTLGDMFNTALVNSEQKRYHRPTDFIVATPINVKKAKYDSDEDYNDDYYDKMERANSRARNDYY